MKKDYQFKIGQKVKVWSEDDQDWIRGEVTDKTSHSVFITWINSTRPEQYFPAWYDKIKLDHSKKFNNQ